MSETGKKGPTPGGGDRESLLQVFTEDDLLDLAALKQMSASHARQPQSQSFEDLDFLQTLEARPASAEDGARGPGWDTAGSWEEPEPWEIELVPDPVPEPNADDSSVTEPDVEQSAKPSPAPADAAFPQFDLAESPINLEAEEPVLAPSPQVDSEEDSETLAPVRPPRPSLIRRLLSGGSFVLGLDVGSETVKYVLVRQSATGMSLKRWGIERIGTEEGDDRNEGTRKALETVLKTLFPSRSPSNLRTYTGFSGLESVFRHVTVPAMPKKEMPDAVRWASRKEVPFPSEESTIEFAVLNGTREKRRRDVLLLAATENSVRRNLELVLDAGFHPQKLTTTPVALSALFSGIGLDIDETVLALDIGAAASQIVLIQQGEVLFAREVSTGGKDFSEALTGTIFDGDRQFQIDPDQAEELKKTYGFAEGDGDVRTPDGLPLIEVNVMMRPVLERLGTEIQRSIDYCRERFNVDRVSKVYLTGGGALIRNLPRLLNREMGMPVILLDPLDKVPIRITDLQRAQIGEMGPALASAFGLALDRSPHLNLLPPAYRESPYSSLIRRVLGYGSLLLIVAVVAITIQQYFLSGKFENDLKRLKAEYSALEPRAREFKKLSSDLKQMKAKLRAYATEVTPDSEAARHLKALSHYIPSDVVLLGIVREVGPGVAAGGSGRHQEQLILSGVVLGADAMTGVRLADFVLNLEKSGYFSRISVRSQGPFEGEEGIIFELICEL